MHNATYIAPMPKWLRAKRYSELSGITPDGISKKRQLGVWLEGQHWKKAPDGNIMINWQECDKWVEHG